MRTDREKTGLFIGNRDCYQVKEADIEQAIITAIVSGITIFLNGGQGYFDKIIYPFESHTFSYYTYKSGSPKRNRWSVDHSSVAICFVYRAGGAERTLKYANKQNLIIVDLTKGA